MGQVQLALSHFILLLQEQKRDLADQIISGEQVSIGSLSREELLKILSPQSEVEKYLTYIKDISSKYTNY